MELIVAPMTGLLSLRLMALRPEWVALKTGQGGSELPEYSLAGDNICLITNQVDSQLSCVFLIPWGHITVIKLRLFGQTSRLNNALFRSNVIIPERKIRTEEQLCYDRSRRKREQVWEYI